MSGLFWQIIPEDRIINNKSKTVILHVGLNGEYLRKAEDPGMVIVDGPFLRIEVIKNIKSMFLDVRIIRIDARAITDLNYSKEWSIIWDAEEVPQNRLLKSLVEHRMPLIVVDAGKIQSEWVVVHEGVLEANLPKGLKQYRALIEVAAKTSRRMSDCEEGFCFYEN